MLCTTTGGQGAGTSESTRCFIIHSLSFSRYKNERCISGGVEVGGLKEKYTLRINGDEEEATGEVSLNVGTRKCSRTV